MTYQPRPINTSHAQAPLSLDSLIEKLAEHNHDIWAQQRIKDGWVWGPKRDDDQKHHPDLVPYNELTENEKQYDRETVIETIKAIVALGYRIEMS